MSDLDDEAQRFRGGDALVTLYSADEVVRVPHEATLADVARQLVTSEVGAVLVGDPEVEGLVSERDIVRAVAARIDLEQVMAVDRMSRELVWCTADATVEEVAELMMEKYVRHVLIGEPHTLAGIVSARDLLGAYVA